MKPLEHYYKGKKVLVTGGAGFIGSHLVEKLVQLGAHVTVCDNFSTGNLKNLHEVLTHITIAYADVTSAYSMIKATYGKDYVFHLAAVTSIPQSFQYPEYCHKVNVEGTINLLEACKKNEVKRMVFASSSAVYGNKHQLCKEEDQPEPLSPYALSKLEGERYCQLYAQQSPLNTASVRYFNVYGERQNPHGQYASVVARFKQNILEKKPLTVYGDGTQTRDFIPVTQVIDATLKIALFEECKGEVFNIGTGNSINLLELITRLEKELNVKKSDITFCSARQGDILHSQADCGKYQKFVAQIA